MEGQDVDGFECVQEDFEFYSSSNPNQVVLVQFFTMVLLVPNSIASDKVDKPKTDGIYKKQSGERSVIVLWCQVLILPLKGLHWCHPTCPSSLL